MSEQMREDKGVTSKVEAEKKHKREERIQQEENRGETEKVEKEKKQKA